MVFCLLFTHRVWFLYTIFAGSFFVGRLCYWAAIIRLSVSVFSLALFSYRLVIILIIIISLFMFFHRCLRDSKTPHISKILLNILAYLKNAIVWMLSIRPQFPNSSIRFSKLLRTVSSMPITVGIIVTFLFHSFLSSQGRSKYVFLFWLCFIFSVVW